MVASASTQTDTSVYTLLYDKKNRKNYQQQQMTENVNRKNNNSGKKRRRSETKVVETKVSGWTDSYAQRIVSIYINRYVYVCIADMCI